MAKWAASFQKANTIEAAIEAIDNTVTIQVIPLSGGTEFLLIQSA